MTDEEAIKILRSLLNPKVGISVSDLKGAINCAIKSLEAGVTATTREP